jgi:hypothetical protein
MLKDVYLLEWLNVNCVRTSHYPYAEEFMQLADRLGIAVIDEVPAVGLIQPENFNPITLNLHKQLLQELYKRDKNHPVSFSFFFNYVILLVKTRQILHKNIFLLVYFFSIICVLQWHSIESN